MRRLTDLFNKGRCREDFRQFVWFAIGYCAVLVLGYLVLRQINLTLSKEEMGRFSYVAGLVTIVMPILYVAAPQAYLRFHDNHAISPRLRKMLLPLFVVSAVGIGAIVWWKTGSVFALVYVAYPFFNERLFILRSQMRTGAVNAMKAAELAVPFLCLLAFSRVFTIDAAAVLAFYGIGYAASFAFPLRLKDAETPDRKTVARFLVPVVFTTLVAALIENLTVVMAKSLLGYEAAAQMGVAARNLIFIKALFALLQMFYPVVYFREMKLRHWGIVRLYRTFILAVAILAVGGMIVFSPILYRMTGATAYLDSCGIFMVLAAAFALDFVFETYGLYFQYEIKTWKSTVVKSIFLVALLVGYAVLRFTSFVPRDHYLQALAGLVLAASLASAATGVIWAVLAERKARV